MSQERERSRLGSGVTFHFEILFGSIFPTEKAGTEWAISASCCSVGFKDTPISGVALSLTVSETSRRASLGLKMGEIN